MFHKNTEKLESLIGCNSSVRGEVESKGTLRADGSIEGNISADWVVVGEKGRIKGNINARGIVVGGRVDGNLKAKEIVEIKNKGQVYGEIFTPKLSIAEGGIFDGKSSMQKEEGSNIVEFTAMTKAGQSL
jgi:cytoskeletal protein CcmA (bactofilin family)